MTIHEIMQSVADGTLNADFEKERERQRKLVQKAKAKKAMMSILAVLCFPIVLFVLVIAELMRTTK